MTSEEQTQTTPTRVSILARIVPVFSYVVPAIGAAVSAWLLLGVFRAMRNAESAGIAAVAGGMSEANIAILVTLYLAILIGMAGIVVGLVRVFTTTVTASPSPLYFLITGVLGLLPMFALWHAQSLVMDVIFSRSPPEGGVSAIAGQITLFSIIAIVVGAISTVILLASAFLPLPAFLRARKKWAPLVMLLIIQTLIIAMTVIYHVRTAWLYAQVKNY